MNAFHILAGAFVLALYGYAAVQIGLWVCGATEDTGLGFYFFMVTVTIFLALPMAALLEVS